MFDKRGRPVFDAALSRSKQDSEYLQHPPIGSLSFGSVWTGDIANTMFGDIANTFNRTH